MKRYGYIVLICLFQSCLIQAMEKKPTNATASVEEKRSAPSLQTNPTIHANNPSQNIIVTKLKDAFISCGRCLILSIVCCCHCCLKNQLENIAASDATPEEYYVKRRPVTNTEGAQAFSKKPNDDASST